MFWSKNDTLRLFPRKNFFTCAYLMLIFIALLTGLFWFYIIISSCTKVLNMPLSFSSLNTFRTFSFMI